MTSTIPLPPPPSPRVPPPPGPWSVVAHPPLVATAAGSPGDRRWRRRSATAGLVVAVAVLVGLGYGPAGAVLVGFAVLTPLERLFRRHPQPVRRPGLRTDVIHLLVSNTLSSAGTIVAVVAWALVLLPVTRGEPTVFVAQPPVLQAVEAFVLFEGLGYIAHRALHEVDLFWRFHAVHHSSTRLDWISGARLHPVEGLIAGALVGAPVILIGVPPEVLGVLTVVTGLWGALLHANIRWRFRWMDGWWGTPDYHHWHHSNHPEARNRNYAAFLPVFDRLFGTYWQPADRRPTVYGLDEPTPPGWWAQVREPLRRRRPRPVHGRWRRRGLRRPTAAVPGRGWKTGADPAA